jgi:proteasome accessory factor B
LHATTVGASDYTKRGELIDLLMIAIEDRLVSLIVYQSDRSTEPVEQEVYPQGFVYHRGSLYLIAWSSRRGEIRTYKMDRIEDVLSTKLPAAVPEEFDLAEWLEHSFGVFRSNSTELQTIRIHFAREVARYVQESRWHGSQQLSVQKDGSLIAEFCLTDTQEIKRWIMSFGPNATVLEPKALVEEIRAELLEMCAAYGDRVESLDEC